MTRTDHILSFDLGTGGNKAALYDPAGRCLASAFVPYPTAYPRPGRHEQRPADWWAAVVESTRQLLAAAPDARDRIAAIGISGHSLGVVPLDSAGRLLLESTPIWSDSRPDTQPPAFFSSVGEADWYMTTGNGFPPSLYSIFKVMWYRDNHPDLFARFHKVIGTKDYINYRLTGRVATDFSYASGSGVYDLAAWSYSPRLLAAAGVPESLLPEILPSTALLGPLTPEAADALNLPRSVRVVAGGVDNSCMALGARAFREGRLYNSLGSSSWIAVSSARPLLSPQSRPYVFAHVVPGMFASAVAIFSAGSSFRWVRDTFCQDLSARAAASNEDVYDLMTAEAARSPVGSRNLLFNPSLAGGSSLDASQNIRGAFLGLDLAHSRPDLLRSAIEGIALGLRIALDSLRSLTPVASELLVVGGGSRSALWRQILADTFNMTILKTTVDQHAAALGAAAVAFVGAGLWPDFSPIDSAHETDSLATPLPANVAVYERLLPIFARAGDDLSRIGDELKSLRP